MPLVISQSRTQSTASTLLPDLGGDTALSTWSLPRWMMRNDLANSALSSIQPVHSDPVLTKAYPKILQPHLWDRVFPYGEYLDGHACVAIGTDAPTTKQLPLPNLYNATARKSALDPGSSQATSPDGAISLIQAAIAATSGAAYSRFAEGWTGSITKGHRADFVVLET